MTVIISNLIGDVRHYHRLILVEENYLVNE